MPFKNTWYVKNKVMHTHYEGNVSLDDIQQVTSDMIKMLDGSTFDAVHVLIDTRNITSQPTNLQAIYRSIKPALHHERFGWMVILNDSNPIERFLTRTVTQLAGIQLKQVESLEEAHDLLERVDASFSREDVPMQP